MNQEQSALRLLESLTPGGSEFVNNPQACYEYVKQLLETQHKQIIKAMSTIDASLFVKQIFELSLVKCRQLVEEVKQGSSFGEAYMRVTDN